jgi:PEGA domain
VDEDELAPRHVLEASTVPELPYDFTDRVMGSLEASPMVTLQTRHGVLPWAIAASACAIAVAASVMVWMGRTPVPQPEPITVIAAQPASPPPASAPLSVAAPAAAPLRGHLVLSVEPRDAIVRVDGQPLTGPSPFVATNLLPGDHGIAIVRDGFEPWTRTIDVPAGELDLPIVLAELAVAQPPSSLKVRPSRGDARRGGGVPTLKDPYGGASEDLADPFHKGDATRPATLRIGTNPGLSAAQVFVDGKSVGITPIADYKVKAGKHQLRWQWKDGVSYRRSLTVQAGEVMIVKGGY